MVGQSLMANNVYCDEPVGISLGKDSTLALGEWKNTGYEFELDLSLPKAVQDLLDQVNNIIEIIQALLSVALEGLRIAKTFLQGLLDPIKAFLDMLVRTLEAIINDLKSVGFYLTGDWWLLDPTMGNFRGGYSPFERRMVGRFTDKTDASLPKIPPTKDVFGVFFYLGVDYSAVDQIRELLVKILQLFRFDLPSMMSVSKMSVPKNLGVRYENLSLTFDNIQDSLESEDGSIPSLAEVYWELSTPTPDPAWIQISPPPAGFFVYVSTTRDGISVHYDKPLPNTMSEEEGSTKPKRGPGQTRDSDGKSPLKIYGGGQQLYVAPSHRLAGVFDSKGEFKDGVSVVYGVRDKNEALPIPIELLVNTDNDGNEVFVYQRMFYISTATIFGVDLGDLSSYLPSIFQSSEYTFTVNREELPYDAEFQFVEGEVILNKDTLTPPNTVYVRVASANVEIDTDSPIPFTSLIGGDVTRAYPYPFSSTLFSTKKDVLISDPSEPVQIVYPTETSQDFLHLIETALYVLITSRADVEVVPTFEMEGRTWVFEENKAAFPTGLEDQGLLIEKILESSPFEFFAKEELREGELDLSSFREEVRKKVERWADILYRQSGVSPELEKSLVEATKEALLDWKFQNVIPFIASAVANPESTDLSYLNVDQEP